MRQKLFVKRSWRFRLSYLLIVPFTIIFFMLLYLINSVLLVKTVVVIGSDSKVQLQGQEFFINKNILLLTGDEINTYLRKKNPTVESVKTEKKFPDRLIITMQTFKPIAMLEARGGYFFLGKDANIMKKQKENSLILPLIHLYQVPDYAAYSIGDLLDYSELKFCLFLLQKLKDMGMEIDTVDINSLSMIVLHQRDKEIFFSTEKDQKVQIYQLEIILKQFRIEGKDFKKLDLRFDKPVVEFK